MKDLARMAHVTLLFISFQFHSVKENKVLVDIIKKKPIKRLKV